MAKLTHKKTEQGNHFLENLMLAEQIARVEEGTIAARAHAIRECARVIRDKSIDRVMRARARDIIFERNDQVLVDMVIKLYNELIEEPHHDDVQMQQSIDQASVLYYRGTV